MILAIIISTNSFGYNTLLVAKGREKISAFVSGISLVVNVVVCFILINIFHIPYYLTVIPIFIAYVTYSLLCSWYSHKLLYGVSRGFFKSVFPRSMIIPYFSAVWFSLKGLNAFLWVPLVLFLLFNRKVINEILITIKMFLRSPQIINVKD